MANRPEPVASSTSDATGRDVGEACSHPVPSSRATIAFGEEFLYELKAGPAGGQTDPAGRQPSKYDRILGTIDERASGLTGDMQPDAKLLRTMAVATVAIITLVIAGRLISGDLMPTNPSTTTLPTALSEPTATTVAPASGPVPRPRHGRLLATRATRAGWLTYVDKVDRLTVTVPVGWSAKPDPIPQLEYPDPVLAVGSWPFRIDHRDSCAPAGILRTLPADGALLVLTESRPTTDGTLFNPDSFGPRPRSFDLRTIEQRDIFCSDQRGFLVLFRQAGRYFSAEIVLGPKAPASRRAAVQQVLENVRPM